MNQDKDALLELSDKLTTLIDVIGIENSYGNLICDYIEELYSKGYPIFSIDIEKQVYIFYNYIKLYSNIINEQGEEYFINHIVDIEINKK